MAVRADVAVPSVIAFLFGAASGLVVGWLVATGGQTTPTPAPAGAPAGGAPPPSAPTSAAQQEAELREALRMHEELLEHAQPRHPLV